MKFQPHIYRSKRERMTYAKAVNDCRMLMMAWARKKKVPIFELDKELGDLEAEAWEAMRAAPAESAPPKEGS